MGKDYWSCTKFADWVRGTPKPMSGTSKEWKDWKRLAKKKKFRYWLAEEGLDGIQNFIFWPKNRIEDIRHYIDNRWVAKTHALTSNLKKGQFHEFDTCLLHSMFDSLVDFVEIEQAWMNRGWSDEGHKKYHIPWYRAIFPLQRWRSPESGIEYLNWAASLKYNDDWVKKDDPDYGKPTTQALGAQETLQLYNWWKEVRPKRPDPMDAIGLSEYYDQRHKNSKEHDEDDFLFDSENETEEERDQWRKLHDICQKIENKHEEEDTEMLIRLVKLRGHLWT